jgi:hypothetical protein
MSWLRRLRNKDKWVAPLGAVLAQETEAFLSGSYVNQRLHRKGAVPGWAWLNTLAHGELDDIKPLKGSSFVDYDDVESMMNAPWRSAQRILANELLSFVDDDVESLSHVQQRVLVPLELRLIDTEANRGLSEFELVRSFRAALRSSHS